MVLALLPPERPSYNSTVAGLKVGSGVVHPLLLGRICPPAEWGGFPRAGSADDHLNPNPSLNVNVNVNLNQNPTPNPTVVVR